MANYKLESLPSIRPPLPLESTSPRHRGKRNDDEGATTRGANMAKLWATMVRLKEYTMVEMGEEGMTSGHGAVAPVESKEEEEGVMLDYVGAQRNGGVHQWGQPRGLRCPVVAGRWPRAEAMSGTWSAVARSKSIQCRWLVPTAHDPRVYNSYDYQRSTIALAPNFFARLQTSIISKAPDFVAKQLTKGCSFLHK